MGSSTLWRIKWLPSQVVTCSSRCHAHWQPTPPVDLDKTAHSNRRIGLHPADIIKSSSRPMGANTIKPFFPTDIQWVEPPTDRQQENKIIQRTFRILSKSPAVVGLQDHQEVHILVGYADRRMAILSTGRGLKPLGSWTFDHCYPDYIWDKFKRAWRAHLVTGGRRHYPLDGNHETVWLWETSVGLRPATDGQSELCATSWARSFDARPATDGLWIKLGRCGRPSSGGESDRWLKGSKWTGDFGSAVGG